MPDPSTHAPGSAIHTEMYGGDVTLSFDEGDHEYFARSEKKDFGKVVSSTQALDKLAKPGLRYWAVNETIDYIENRWDPGQEYDEIEIDEILSDAKNARFKSSGRAKKIGSVVHEWIEEYVQANAEGRSVTVVGPNQGEVDTKHVRDISLPYNEKAQDAIKQFLSWTEDHEITWLAAEQKAFSRGKGYAGTYDADAVIDGKRTLIDWKGLPLDTKLPTPNGWTTIREVEVGDRVLGPDGKPCSVTGKSNVHERETYKIRFDDGSEVIADDEHQWLIDKRVRNSSRTKKDVVMTTEEMVDFLEKNEGLKVQDIYYLYVNNPSPVNLPEKELPIDPYVYGAWLGDGTVNGGKITSIDEGVLNKIEERGYEHSDVHGNDDTKAPTYTIYGLRSNLRKNNLWGDRDVPNEYLRGSISQRLDLLRGVMDTDGTYNTKRKQAVLEVTDRKLAKAIEQVVLSLGERPYVIELDVNGFGKETTAWRVSWRCTQFNPFSLKRKSDLVEISDGNSTRRQIKSIEKDKTVDKTQCIQVDSESSCYLATKNWIPTHNTSKRIYDEYPLQAAAYVYAREEESAWKAKRHGTDRIRYGQMMILRVPKTGGEFEIWQEDSRKRMARLAEVFQSLLDVYKWDNE